MPLDWEVRSMPFRAKQQNFLSFYDDVCWGVPVILTEPFGKRERVNEIAVLKRMRECS